MKKTILVVLVLILAMLCLTSCQDGKYAELNQISKNNYNQVQIDVTVKKSGENSALVSSFKVLNADITKQIEYSVQEYAMFDINGDQISAPESQIVTKTGTVVLENGKVASQTGDQTGLRLSSLPWTTDLGSYDMGRITGGGQAHNNMPPYITVNVWWRRA